MVVFCIHYKHFVSITSLLIMEKCLCLIAECKTSYLISLGFRVHRIVLHIIIPSFLYH